MKRCQTFSLLLLFGSALSLCPGCSGLFSAPEYHETSTYDLGFPEVRKPLPFPLIVQPFSSDTSARYKILFRNGGRLDADEFSRWSRTPPEMLTRYCRIAFSRSMDRSSSPGTVRREFVLTGSVLAFEADKGANVCRLYVKCSLCDAENSSRALWARTYFVTAPASFAHDSPGEGASASMRVAAESLIRELYQDLSGLRDLPAGEGKQPGKGNK